MKKKIIAVVLLLCVTLLALTACFGEKEKEFTVQEMTITLTTMFTEKDVYGQTKCFQSIRTVVTVLKESNSSLGVTSDFTLNQYTQAVLKANNLKSSVTKGDKYYSFSYEKDVSGQTYYYFATTHKADNAFWLIQFSCFSSDKDKYQAKFEKWADSVVFEANA